MTAAHLHRGLCPGDDYVSREDLSVRPETSRDRDCPACAELDEAAATDRVVEAAVTEAEAWDAYAAAPDVFDNAYVAYRIAKAARVAAVDALRRLRAPSPNEPHADPWCECGHVESDHRHQCGATVEAEEGGDVRCDCQRFRGTGERSGE